METKENSYNWQGQTILVVEDDFSSFLFMEALIKKNGANMLHAKDGEIAVEMSRKNPDIDLVLMDIQLPKLDGYEATKKIKKIRKNLPVIAQTAHAMEEDRKLCLESGCDDYISKPIKKEMLFMLMDKYIG
jgi:CheY-like chemotaxis protein